MLHINTNLDLDLINFQAAEAGKEAAAQAGKMLTKGIGGFAGKAFGSFF